jgi:hypothetical protein
VFLVSLCICSGDFSVVAPMVVCGVTGYAGAVTAGLERVVLRGRADGITGAVQRG